MAENAFVKIGTALLKHQVKKLVGEEALGAIGEELADIGGDKLDAWIGEQSTVVEIEKAADTARDLFRGKVNDDEVEQWMVMLPIQNLPSVLSAIEELPTSPDETKLENALRESIALNWKRLSAEQVNNAVAAFMSSFRSALLPIEKQTLTVIGRSVLRTEDKINQLLRLVEQLQVSSSATRPSSLVTRPGWFFGHRYGDLENFTGRTAEIGMLDDWLANDTDNLLLITAFGGFGKSALTWQWFNNKVDKAKWQTAVWWSFYEKESGFESFLAETLNHLGVEVKQSARLQLNDLLEAMRGTNILIVLDGFERLLRQYGRMDAALQSDDEDADIDPSQRDCSSPLTETFLRGLSGAGMKSKVLMTTRLCPRVLESADGKLLKGCREEPLAVFSPEDAVTYFHNEGIEATRAEIIEACAAYGYHPLSLSLLVGLINADHERRGDIAAVKNLEIFADVKARRHHVLERAYGSLAPERRDLLSKMSCFRGSMEYAVLKKVFPSPDLNKALLDLRKRGLLQYAGETGRYDMHPIVRHYAYNKFAAPDKTDAHTRLVKYFEAVPPPQTITTLEDLAPVIELYHHMVGAGNLDEAMNLYYDRLWKQIFYQFGSYQLEIELLLALIPDGEDKPPRLKREDAQGWTLNELAGAYSLNGQPRHAIPFIQNAVLLAEKTGNKNNVAIGLANLAREAQLQIGRLREAERNLRRSSDLCRETGNKLDEAVAHLDLGRILSYRGIWHEADLELEKAQNDLDAHGQNSIMSAVRGFRSLHLLLKGRADTKPGTQYLNSAIVLANNAIEKALVWQKLAGRPTPNPRDMVRSHWLLGSAYRASNELTLAEENLSKALNLSRQINLVESEANILLDIARLRYAQGDFKDAQEKASEALVITERSGYVLQGADVHLLWAEVAWEMAQNAGDKQTAREHVLEARRLATCDGPPDYTYRVAYEEAGRMMERMKAEG